LASHDRSSALNIFGPANIPQLEEVVLLLEKDDHVKVVIFESAVEGFFLTHYDFLAKPEDSATFPVGRTRLQALPDMLARISRAPVDGHAAGAAFLWPLKWPAAPCLHPGRIS
jgi:enoyl-CoA hydratase/carnithine racemase